jgi:hypothetical protein
VKIAAFSEVSAAMTMRTAVRRAPSAPSARPTTSAATACERATPSTPSAAKKDQFTST